MAKRSPRHAANGIARSTGGATNRCAVYTRKSSEEGLEQAFNSLDAQREACEAYILSQRHEGWRVLPEMYDDGGVSGATMERPALQRLLADIRARRIDTVVVYKVDRLTRSLSDFAKIVEVFDGHGVSFVSVTQAFNTTTSMGRLTLNMLLSFAQFEREVTSERIRDKIAASKQKGLWMGGLPPLGYDVSDRRLVINTVEAETVRHIFRRYADLHAVRELQQELDAAGIVSKRRLDRFGRATGGRPLARGALYLMLQNRLYRGEIVHKDTSYPGAHDAIIDEGLWDNVQKTQRTGMAMRLLVEGGGRARREPDRSLLRLLARAQHFNTLMLESRGQTIRDLAAAAGVTPSYFTRVLRLSFLAPDIVMMIMRGQQPPQLTANQLIGRSDLAPSWPGQAARLGIA